MRNLLSLVCLALGGWALVGSVPYGILAAIILGACAIALIMERPRTVLKRRFDNRLRRAPWTWRRF